MMKSSLSLILALSLILSGCSSNSSKPEPEAVELKASQGRNIELPEVELLNEGMRLFEGGYYTVARDNFESLRTNYPLSPYSELAAIKSADCQFETNDFGPAAVAYEDFYRNHPVSESTSYALFMAARSNQLSNRGLGRDVAPLEKALELYTRLLTEYPDSPYLDSAREHKHQVEQDLSEYEKLVADYYRKRAANEAADLREKLRSEKWDLRLAAEAPSPSGPAPIGVVAASAPTVTLPPPQAATANPAPALSAASSHPSRPFGQPDLIQTVQCTREGSKKVYLLLNRPIGDPSFAGKYQRLSPENGALNFVLPGASNTARTLDCFGTGDLTISTDGRVSLKSQQHGRTLELSNPDRLLIVVK